MRVLSKMYWKCILNFSNQKSLVRRAWATWFWQWRCAVARCRAWRKLLWIHCIAVQKRAVQFTKKRYLLLFSSETADNFANDYAIKKASVMPFIDYFITVDQVQFEFHNFTFWLENSACTFNTLRAVHAPVSHNLNTFTVNYPARACAKRG